MLTSTLDMVPGRQIIEHLGLVQGSTVRTKHLGRDIMASVKELVGGELRGYTELLNEARAEAMSRMCVAAKELGADAILSIRFGTANIGGKAAEILVYGTAVRLSPEAASAS